MNLFQSFTNLYSLSKTLRFELIPVGKTEENIQKHGLIQKDEERATDYEQVKEILDFFHRDFIEKVLAHYQIPEETLRELEARSKGKDQKEAFDKASEELQKEISKAFKACENYSVASSFKEMLGGKFVEQIIKKLDDKVLDSELLSKLNEVNDHALDRLAKFKGFTTYFVSYNQTRENVYSAGIATGIPYRIVVDNLPKYLQNMKALATIKERLTADEYEAWSQKLDSQMQLMQGNSFSNRMSMASISDVQGFNLVLSQSGIEAYNAFISGYTKEERVKEQGVNELVNLYNQKHQLKGSKRLPFLQPLHKQILSERIGTSWRAFAFESSKELLEAIKGSYQDFYVAAKDLKALFSSLQGKDELETIYVDAKELSRLSSAFFGDWSFIEDCILWDYDSNLDDKGLKEKERRPEMYRAKRIKALAKQNSYSLASLNAIINKSIQDKAMVFPSEVNLADYFSSLGADRWEWRDLSWQKNTEANVFDLVEVSYLPVEPLLDFSDETDGQLKDQKNVDKIKALMDAILVAKRFAKLLQGVGEEDRNMLFYSIYSPLIECLEGDRSVYDKVRNFFTKKPYSEEKVKLNFDNATLLAGWDISKEEANQCTLLIKDEQYFLVIMTKTGKQLFRGLDKKCDGDYYEKIRYKLLPDPKKMLPKVVFSKLHEDLYNPPAPIRKIKESKSYAAGANYSEEDMRRLIDFYKDSIKKNSDWSVFNFKFSETESYTNILDFFNEVEAQGYQMDFDRVPVSLVEDAVNNGQIYLFKIYNKDFSSFSKGLPNLHTLYWKALFDNVNLNSPAKLFKLNGQAEIFYRKASIPKKITHPKKVSIKNKNPKAKDETSIFPYDLYKDKRFMQDKFHFHVPITLNFRDSSKKSNLNQLALDAIRAGKVRHVIGIDRGERHLLYLSMVDLNGKIVKQYTLNEIVSHYTAYAADGTAEKREHRVDYNERLSAIESERDKQRKSWSQIENIKELKEGYMSQVVHQVSKMMIEYDAIVVLESLNMGFKRGRQKVEKSIYQKFEKMLIDKLNFLVPDKAADPNKPGGLYKAYQLTNPIGTFKDLEKLLQSGFLFFVSPWNTSNIDPVTGFCKLFRVKYENIALAKEFFGKFDRISFDGTDFIFDIDYSKFDTYVTDPTLKWKLTSRGERIQKKRINGRWQSDEQPSNLTELFKTCFDKYEICYCKGEDLVAKIVSKESKDFFVELIYLTNLLLEMRNSNKIYDFICSPALDSKGMNFQSQKQQALGEKAVLPIDADANGAYNIARKGLMYLEQIQGGAEKLSTIGKAEWLEQTQKKK